MVLYSTKLNNVQFGMISGVVLTYHNIFTTQRILNMIIVSTTATRYKTHLKNFSLYVILRWQMHKYTKAGGKKTHTIT